MKSLRYLWIIVAFMAVSCGGGTEPGGKETPVTLKVSPSSLNFGAEDSSAEAITVTTNGNWSLSVANGGSWCITDTRSGSGTATVHVTVSANTTTSARSTTISFSGAGGTSASVTVNQEAGEENPISVTTTDLSASPRSWDGVKRAGITYQLLAYSFADSDSDGWGDIHGIESRLDYLDALGVSAMWISPLQKASSYHGYDINDYATIDSRYGDDDSFASLISGASAKGIDIYMDYVLNHSGTWTKWFQDAIGNASSKYRSYYVFSNNPTEDVRNGRVDNFAGAGSPGLGDWYSTGVGVGYKGRLHFLLDWTGSSKTVTVTASSGAVQSSNSSATKWLWIGSVGAVGLYETSSGIFEITIDVDTDWGFLVRTASGDNWSAGTKWGAPSGSGAIVLGKPFTLMSNASTDPGNIVFGDNVSYYFGSFDRSMPDLNYGPYASASSSACFKAIAETADKWVNMGVNGFRLDAVRWIYQDQTKANVSFLKQWYDRMNTTYRSRGGEGDIYMVGEAWTDTADQMAPYYQGLPSNFNFFYWWTLKDRLNKGKGNDFASTVLGFRRSFASYRTDFIDAIKLSNHDETRAATDLGRSLDKEKLAAAVLLTSPGKPFVYQGEELGYWGSKDSDDAYVRTPIKWTRSGSVPSAALSGKVDNSMLTADISVEAQEADEGSLLNVYRTFAKLRNTYPALADGEMTEHSTYNSSNSRFAALAAWYMTLGSEKLLVVHNFGSSRISASFGAEDLGYVAGLLGSGELKTTTDGGVLTDNTLTIGGYSSVVFVLSE